MLALEHIYAGRTLNIAHRGASGRAPQNTLAAFLLAAEMGADGIELDVRLAADGEVVVIHDATVDAVTGSVGRVSQMTVAELSALDAGRRFDPKFAGQRIPTLQQVFDAVGRRLFINIEIKVEKGDRSIGLEAETVRLIEDNHLVDRVIISSFNPSSLRRVRKLNPNIALGLLYGQVETHLFARLARMAGVKYAALHPGLGLVNAKYVRKAHKQGYRVNVWTVNKEPDMRRMLDIGVDAIITNHPDVLGQLLSHRT